METLAAITERRSVRRFLDIPVEKEKLGLILEAGREAPSTGNLQPWRFILVKDAGMRKKIADICLQQWWMQKAPAIIIVCANVDKCKQYYGIRGERLYSIQNAAAAATNMMLAAHDVGLATTWVSAFNEDQLARTFGIPGDYRAQVVLPIGYPDERPKRPVRHLLETIVYVESWGNRVEDIHYLLGHFSGILARKIKEAKKATAKLVEKSHGLLKR